MPCFRLLLTVSLLLLAPLSVVAAASSENAGALQSAAAVYQSGDYDKAYRQYLKLAKDGEQFAQYRVSYMNLTGLGTRSDIVDSLAWAVLAAEGENASLEAYKSAVAALVPSDKRKKAQRTASNLMRRYGGKGDRESEWGVMSDRYQRGCTGAKLATNCGRSGSTRPTVHIAWGSDKSNDPAQRERIEELNEDILDSKLAHGPGMEGS